ncbi:Protein CBG18903 [Caenorhabditis briggsae]|uniref:Protein CBG18903 n=1 Tax=Caenorhabditis briggsae TaxID=6238 RepID=A8XUB8_CAEBR|nr:Protein CBG18903 [Caenorhabditis briggsae]CAP36243.2 Protein CBG18903 [Caenorhabditis briggsae]
MGFFDDKKREEVRRRQNTGFLTDYLIRSEITDYYRLRLLVNFILGLLISSSLYHAGWKNLNFGDFDYTSGLIVKWTIVSFSTYAFTVSPTFRCALFCVLIGAFGKQGQYPFTMLVMSNIQEGPITNMMSNYETTSEIVMCHIELQSKIVANRVALLTGPLEELIEKLMAKGIRAMKAVSRETRALITPFMELLKKEKTKTDTKIEIERNQLRDIEKRKERILKMWEKSMNRKLTEDDEIAAELLPAENLINNVTIGETPIWQKFKTPLVQKMANKMSKNCEEMFNKGIDKCRNVASELVTSCKDAIIWPIEAFICPKLNVEGLCDKGSSLNICRNQLEDSHVDPTVEKDIMDVMELTEQLEDNSKIELHSVRVETPRVAIEYRLSDLKIKIRAANIYFKSIVGVSKQIFQAFFIYFVYTIFRDSVGMIRKYQDDVAFSNSFVTKEFWMIDSFRESQGQTHLSHFSKQEKIEWKIMEVFSFPTKAERSKAIRPFFKWFVLALTVAVIVIMDYYLFVFLDSVVESARQQVKQKASAPAGLNITGEGVLADFLKTMTSTNETLEIDQTLSNEHCLTKPLSPNTDILIYWLGLPLLLSFLFQVVFSFVIRRIVLNYFLPFMFPQRSRVRLIQFYNKVIGFISHFLPKINYFLCLVNREKHRKEARARIRFTVDRRRIETLHKGEFSAGGSFLKRHVFERISKTAKCFLCQEKTYAGKLLYCAEAKCQSSFCKDCIDDNFGTCYACMVIKKEITDQKSKLMAPSEADKKDEFLSYDEFLERMEHSKQK